MVSLTYEDLKDFLISIEGIMILAIILFFIMILAKSSDKYLSYFFFLFGIMGFFLLVVPVSADINGQTFEGGEIDWDTAEDYNDCYFGNLTIWLKGNWIGAKDINYCEFVNVVFESNMTSTENLYFRGCSGNDTTFNRNSGASRLDVRYYSANWFNNVYYSGTAADYRIWLYENYAANQSYMFNLYVEDTDVYVWEFKGNFHLNNFTKADEDINYNGVGGHAAFLYMQYLTFTTTYDYVLLYNKTYDVTYNVTGSRYIDLTALLFADSFPFEMLAVDYSVNAYKDDIHYELSNQTFINKSYSFIYPSLITLTLDIRNSLGNPVNNVSVSIFNNDTGDGYYTIINGIGTKQVLSGNLFFHVSQTDDDLETRTFEYLALGNVTIIIYLNLTDIIDFDRELIEYENQLRGELLFQLAGWVILICFTIFVLWVAVFRRIVNDGF